MTLKHKKNESNLLIEGDTTVVNLGIGEDKKEVQIGSGLKDDEKREFH